MLINARRLMENIGWNATSGESGKYLVDGIHYTGVGAQSLSAAVVSAMMGEMRVSGCPSDPGAVTLQSSLTLIVEIGGTSACAHHGQLQGAQSLTLNQPALTVAFTDGFTPAAGEQFKILSFASTSGAFGSITLPSLPSGLSWDTDALYTTGTISVAASPPAPPTITVTSGGTQEVTLPASPAPIAFTVSGSGTLTVTASSSNPTVLPDSGISISAGCGTGESSCTATLNAATGQTGSSTVSLKISDTFGQTSLATATLAVESASSAGSSAGSETGSAGESLSRSDEGGGGSLEFITLLVLMVLLMRGLHSGRAHQVI
ncbi:MAG: hypothetical protein ABW034_10815 [Steroidobacteraceae bacterium]